MHHPQVMDDNRILTLASNERIPLTSSMRLVLEVDHMNHCSPATVSRGGVIFVNNNDIGWNLVGRDCVKTWATLSFDETVLGMLYSHVMPTEYRRWQCVHTCTVLTAIHHLSSSCRSLRAGLMLKLPLSTVQAWQRCSQSTSSRPLSFAEYLWKVPLNKRPWHEYKRSARF